MNGMQYLLRDKDVRFICKTLETIILSGNKLTSTTISYDLEELRMHLSEIRSRLLAKKIYRAGMVDLNEIFLEIDSNLASNGGVHVVVYNGSYIGSYIGSAG